MVYDNFSGTKKVDVVNNAIIVVLLGFGGVLQFYGYGVFGVAVVCSLMVKGISGLVSNKIGKNVNLMNAIMAAVSVILIGMAIKYNVSFSLPELREMFGRSENVNGARQG